MTARHADGNSFADPGAGHLEKFPGLLVQPVACVYYRLVVDQSFKEFGLDQWIVKPASTERGLALNAASLE
jgi:hypothetical protein